MRVIDGVWFDVGTHDSLLDASIHVREKDFRARFHPMIEEALVEFNQEFKRIVALK